MGISSLFSRGLSTSRAGPGICQVSTEGPLFPPATRPLPVHACLSPQASGTRLPSPSAVQSLVPDRHRSNSSSTPSHLLGAGRITAPSLSVPDCGTGSWPPTRKGCCEVKCSGGPAPGAVPFGPTLSLSPHVQSRPPAGHTQTLRGRDKGRTVMHTDRSCPHQQPGRTCVCR